MVFKFVKSVIGEKLWEKFKEIIMFIVNKIMLGIEGVKMCFFFFCKWERDEDEWLYDVWMYYKECLKVVFLFIGVYEWGGKKENVWEGGGVIGI